MKTKKYIRFIRYIRVRKASPTSALNQGKTKTFSLPEEAKRGVKSALLLSHFPQFVRLFCPKSSFFANSWKKSLPNVWSVRKKVVPLHSLSEKPASEGSAKFTWALPSAAVFGLGTSQHGGHETRSLTDCEQYKDKQRAYIYNMYVHKQQSHSF